MSEVFDSCDSLTPANGSWAIAGGGGDFALNTMVVVNGKFQMIFADTTTPSTYPYNFGGMFYKRPSGTAWNFIGKELIRFRITRSGTFQGNDLANLQLELVTNWTGPIGAQYLIGDKIRATDTEITIDIDLRDTPNPIDLSTIQQLAFGLWENIPSPTQFTVDNIELLAPPWKPLEARITPSVQQEVYENGVVEFACVGVYGTQPYTYKWFVNGAQDPDPSSTTSKFTFVRSNSGSYSVLCEVTDSANSKIFSDAISVSVLAYQPFTPYLPNFILLQDQNIWYTGSNKAFILDQKYREQLLRDLSHMNIQYVVVFVGFWDATNPSAPTIWHYSPSALVHDWVRTPAYYQEFIAQCHVLGIKVLCWIEDSSVGTMDISPANYDNIWVKIKEAIDMGFDGFADDIENWVGKDNSGTGEGTTANNVTQNAFLNDLTQRLHSLPTPKIHAPFTAFDWTQSQNEYLNVDFIQSMFYTNKTTLADPQCDYFWQEQFGEYSGHTIPPASPLIVGLFFHVNNPPEYDTMTEQIVKLDQLIANYGHPKMYGFFIWYYETMTSQDIVAWNNWIGTMPSKGIPPTLEQVTFNVATTTNGGTSLPVGANTVAVGTFINAIPNSGYQFKEWLLDAISYSTAKSIPITQGMSGKTLTATFEPASAPVQLPFHDNFVLLDPKWQKINGTWA